MKKEPHEENCFQVKEFRTFVMYCSLLYMLTTSKDNHFHFFLYTICLCVCVLYSPGWLSVLYCSKVTPDLLMALVPSEMKSV